MILSDAKKRVLETSCVCLTGLAIAVLCAAGCSSSRGLRSAKQERGIKFPHQFHVEQGIGCADCHSIEIPETDELTQALDVAVPLMPTHELCSLCHEIIGDADDASSCAFCHERPDQLVDDIVPIFDAEKIFLHEPHVDNDIACTVCHDDPDKARLVKGPIMQFCMDCHQQTAAAGSECATCHTTLNDQTRPQFRGGVRLAHDVPEIWDRIHGRESQIDAAYCALCHEEETHCVDCHRRNAPDSHTVSWRRRNHGLRAAWDRNACSVCHEEDSCMKCHQNTKPRSHRGRWESPVNGHCVSCHFPREQTNCTVCHESIEHASALPSPHNFGIFPANCALCHPGGLPRLAPHPLNSTASCLVCHT